MKNTILALIILFVLMVNGVYAQTPISTAHFFQHQDFDVLHYNVDVDMTAMPASKYITGVSTILLRWSETAIPHNFYFHSLGITPDSLFFNSEKWTYSIETDAEGNTYYSVPQMASDIDIDTIKIFYSGEMYTEESQYPWGGVQNDDNVVYAIGVGMYNSEVSCTSAWFPCYDHPSDKASFSCKYTVADTLTIASNGLLIETTENAEAGTKTFHWDMQSDAATYLLTFSVGKLHKLVIDDNPDCPVHVYSQAKDTTKCRFVFSRVTEMKEFQEELFGEYPFEKIGYVISEKGSMEHQTMINLAQAVLNSAYNGEDDANATVFHELNHQWFGNSISPLDFRNAWLNESFAKYSEALWVEYNDSTQYLRELAGDRAYYLNTSAKQDKDCPLYDFDAELTGNYPYTIYVKGAVVLGMLRFQMEHYPEFHHESFLDFLKEYYQTYKGKNISTNEFVRFFNETFEIDYTWFFDQWVYGNGYPKLAVEKMTYKDPETKQTMVSGIKITQIQEEEFGLFHTFPFEITYKNTEGSTFNNISNITKKETYIDLTGENILKSGMVVNSYNRVVPMVQLYSNKTTEVKEAPEKTFSLYPNPAKQVINIDYPESLIDKHISITNAAGQVVYQQIFHNQSTEVDVSNLPSGNYIFNISDENTSVARSFQIVR